MNDTVPSTPDTTLPAGDPAWADRAIDALERFEPAIDDFGQLAVVRALAAWRHAPMLTDLQADEVVARVLRRHSQRRDDPATAPATRAQVLAKVASLCTGGLPVPSSFDVTRTHYDLSVWLTLRLDDPAEVDAWASRLGLTAAMDQRIHDGLGQRWSAYGSDVYDAQAEASWAPGVTRVHVWCSVYLHEDDKDGRS